MTQSGPVQEELSTQASLMHGLAFTFNQWPANEAE